MMRLLGDCELEFDFDYMTFQDHSHTPWLIVLYKYLQIWKSQVRFELCYEKTCLRGFRPGLTLSGCTSIEDCKRLEILVLLHSKSTPLDMQKSFFSRWDSFD